MINITELRSALARHGTSVLNEDEILELLEAAEKERDWNAERLEDAIEECAALRAKIEAMEQQEPVAWGAFYFGGKLNGKLYSQCATEAQIDKYIVDRHRSDDSNTFRKAALYALPGAHRVPSFADAYQGAMEEVAIWKRRALEAEDLNRKFIAEINGPMHMGEPAPSAPSVPSVPSVPVEAIGKMLADAMAVAVSNGANSVSMPDEYVEVAVWLHGECPTQPLPSIPEGWKLVPIDPAQEMLRAGNRWANGLAYETYKAMITVAPEAES